MFEHRGRIIAINHVELESRVGLELDLQWFYGECIGLRPVEVVEKGDGAVLRFRSDRLELRVVITEEPVIESVDRRAQFEVPSLEEASSKLGERNYDHEWVHGLAVTDRALMLLDPAGNRVLIRRKWPFSPI